LGKEVEKANGCTTGVNRSEESDCAIIPMNEPNVGEPLEKGLNAEVGEGRALTKESISQAYTNPTQGGKKGVSQGLAGVRQAARAKKGERLTAPLHHS
jgi:RNA-directed DNA polymerase